MLVTITPDITSTAPASTIIPVFLDTIKAYDLKPLYPLVARTVKYFSAFYILIIQINNRILTMQFLLTFLFCSLAIPGLGRLSAVSVITDFFILSPLIFFAALILRLNYPTVETTDTFYARQQVERLHKTETSAAAIRICQLVISAAIYK
jgi:hypothetical protein